MENSVADSRLRDLGTIVPGAARLAAPDPPSLPPPPLPAPPIKDQGPGPGTSSPSGPVFAADLPDGADALGLDAPLGLLAELAAHKRTETPLTIGFLGPSGSGKSFAMAKLVQSIEELSHAAPPASPFVGEILSFHVDATDISGNPATALAGVLHSVLARMYPALAAEAAHAARDPVAAVSETLENLNTFRRKLEAEKRALDETNVRRARLAETLLYETAGSQAYAYAAANRSRIKNLFSRLGIPGESLLAYKDMAGTIASAGSVARRAGFALKAFFAFKGQTKLIVAASLLCLAGFGLRIAVDQQAAWLAWLRSAESSVPIANWLETHMDLLLNVRGILFLGAALAIGINVWRGFQLLRLVLRGADLLDVDLVVRRRELDDLFAFQARRVDALASEVNILSRRAAEAERRAGSVPAGSTTLPEPAPFAVDTGTGQARAFAAAAGAMLAGPSQPGTSKSGGAPRRIVVALDHLDAVPVSRGREILAHARALFKQGFIVLIAADSARLCGPAGGIAPDLDKWIQVPFQLCELASRANYATLVGQILGGSGGGEQRIRDAAASVLDQPVSAAEARLLAGLAPLAGSSARALKRFVNLYRLARAQKQIHKGALAFMLALDAGGTQAEIAAVRDALSQMNPEEDLELRPCSARLAEALAATRSVQGKVSVNDARRAAAAARLFSFNLRVCDTGSEPTGARG